MANGLEVNVCVRASQKTGKVDKVMTGMGTALMKMWALNNTPKTKWTFIFERETGKCVFACMGTPDGFPKVAEKDRLGTCEDLGITLEQLKELGQDDRFD